MPSVNYTAEQSQSYTGLLNNKQTKSQIKPKKARTYILLTFAFSDYVVLRLILSRFAIQISANILYFTTLRNLHVASTYCALQISRQGDGIYCVRIYMILHRIFNI